jgi:hypothetical protein
VLEQEPHAGSSAAVVLDLAQAGVKFLETRTTTGTAQHVDRDCLIESIALDNALNHAVWNNSYQTTNDINFGALLKGPTAQGNNPRQVQLSATLRW